MKNVAKDLQPAPSLQSRKHSKAEISLDAFMVIQREIKKQNQLTVICASPGKLQGLWWLWNAFANPNSEHPAMHPPLYKAMKRKKNRTPSESTNDSKDTKNTKRKKKIDKIIWQISYFVTQPFVI